MADEIQKFDPSKLMDGVKDRIKATFVSLIPDDAWDQMVKTEVDKFFKKGELGYTSRQMASDFDIIVRSMLEAEAKSRLVKYLESEEFQSIWANNGQPTTAKAVEDIIVKNSGEILVNMFGGLFTSMLQDFRNKLRNNQY